VCVDGFGPVSAEERAAGLPGHGEAYRARWEVQSWDKVDATLTVRFTVSLPLVQEVLRRTIRLVDGEQIVYVESELESLLAFDRPINWAEHEPTPCSTRQPTGGSPPNRRLPRAS
jgi:hypothetical protein